SVEEARAMTEEQLQETITEIAFEIIANVGTARGMYIEAIQEAKAGNFDQAAQLLKDGKEAFVQGHHSHVDLLEWQGQGLTWKTNIRPCPCHSSRSTWLWWPCTKASLPSFSSWAAWSKLPALASWIASIYIPRAVPTLAMISKAISVMVSCSCSSVMARASSTEIAMSQPSSTLRTWSSTALPFIMP